MTVFDEKNAPDHSSDQGQGTEDAGNVVPPHRTTNPENGTANRQVFSPTLETLRQWIAKAEADPHYAGRGQVERWKARVRAMEAAAREAEAASQAEPASLEAASASRGLLELAEHHLAMLRASKISDDVIRARGYRTVTNPIELVTLGFDEAQARTPGLLLPGHTPDGQLFSVYRPDNPRCLEEKNKKKNPDGTYPQKVLKYEFPKDQSMRLDCPPTCQPQLADPSIPLWITEGQKKGDALASAGKCVIALLGVWNWRGTNKLGGKTALADWNFVALNGRPVIIVFDSDIRTNRNIQQALSSLAGFLANKGAVVKTVILPDSEARGKTGVDDWLADGHTPAELDAMLQEPPRVASRYELVLSDEYIQALETLGYTFRMLELDQTVEVNGEPLTDALEAEIRTKLRDAGYPQVNIARDAFITHAYHNLYHPIKKYLESLTWDGQDHIQELAGYFTDIDGVFYAWLKKWLVGAVARVYKDGAQNRVLVLGGEQDLGKSTFVRWLAGKLTAYYIDSAIDPENKDDHIRLMRVWIWEIGELSATTARADRNALKQFLSREQVRARPPYGRHDVIRPAMTSFIATANNDGGFLNDPTGSRRFAVCALLSIDWSYARQVDVNQVWAQAKALYDAKFDWRYTGAEKELVTKINERYEVENPVFGYLDEIIRVEPGSPKNLAGGVTTVEILHELHYLGARGSEIALAREIASYMKKRGIEQGFINTGKAGGKREQRRGWRNVALLKNSPANNNPEEPEEPEEFRFY